MYRSGIYQPAFYNKEGLKFFHQIIAKGGKNTYFKARTFNGYKNRHIRQFTVRKYPVPNHKRLCHDPDYVTIAIVAVCVAALVYLIYMTTNLMGDSRAGNDYRNYYAFYEYGK